MKKNYVAPEVEIITVDHEGCLCSSTLDKHYNLNENEQWAEETYSWN